MELWTLGATSPSQIARQAATAEQRGWDGLLVPDSQSMSGDAFVSLTIAAMSTSMLKLGTGVTNPYTRHPAVLASVMASLQEVSDGRAVLGIGRGDSALANLGLSPASPAMFERFLGRLQAYLRGEPVSFDLSEREEMRPVDDLAIGHAPDESRLAWLRPEVAKVPVDVAATGPRVIGLAARHAERLTFAVGADPDRLRWAIATAREAREQAGLDPADLTFGAYLNVVAHPDPVVAEGLASAGVTALSRFSAMHGKPAGNVSQADGAVLRKLATAYDLREHGSGSATHRSAVDADYIGRFGIVGHPGHCIERMSELAEVGLNRMVVLGGFADATDRSREALEFSRKVFEEDVLPAVRKVPAGG